MSLRTAGVNDENTLARYHLPLVFVEPEPHLTEKEGTLHGKNINIFSISVVAVSVLRTVIEPLKVKGKGSDIKGHKRTLYCTLEKNNTG